MATVKEDMYVFTEDEENSNCTGCCSSCGGCE